MTHNGSTVLEILGYLWWLYVFKIYDSSCNLFPSYWKTNLHFDGESNWWTMNISRWPQGRSICPSSFPANEWSWFWNIQLVIQMFPECYTLGIRFFRHLTYEITAYYSQTYRHYNWHTIIEAALMHHSRDTIKYLKIRQYYLRLLCQKQLVYNTMISS